MIVPTMTSIDMATTASVSEIWPPYINRDNMSRPISSVPSRWLCHPGGIAVPCHASSIAAGSYGAIHFASSAARTKMSSTPAPASAKRCRENFFHARLRRDTVSSSGRTSGWTTSLTTAMCVLLVVLHARIEPAVRKIREQVEKDDEDRDDDEVAHQEREVLLEESGDEQAAHPRPREDRLGHDRASDQERDRQRDDGDHRHETVLESVLEEDRHERKTLRGGGAHVIGVQHFLHRGAREARPRGDLQQREHADR